MGTDHDTAEFAVESIRRWWQQLGAAQYRRSRHLLITADCGGSNGYRNRLWKLKLQEFADETGLTLHVCHFPPGTRSNCAAQSCLVAQLNFCKSPHTGGWLFSTSKIADLLDLLPDEIRQYRDSFWLNKKHFSFRRM